MTYKHRPNTLEREDLNLLFLSSIHFTEGIKHNTQENVERNDINIWLK
jgi:hypothetical protein